MARSVAGTVRGVDAAELSFVRRRSMTYVRRVVLPLFGLMLAISYRLWLSTRGYPLSPVLSIFPQPPFPLDYLLLGTMLLALLGAATLRRPQVSLNTAIGLDWRGCFLTSRVGNRGSYFACS